MSFATLRALYAIIGDALTDLERIYQAQPSSTDGIPLDFPSLDEPCYPGAPQSADAAAAEKLALAPDAVVAARQIVAACAQLSASVHLPFYSLVETAKGGHLAACLGFLEASNTVEILRAAGPEGLRAEEIARRIAESGAGAESVDPIALSHILRFLATHHWLREVRPNVFANNRLSAQLDTGKTPDQIRGAPEKKHEDTDSPAAFVALSSDETLKSAAYLVDALLPNRGRAVALRALHSNASAPQAGATYATPFHAAFRTELGYYNWIELPENKVRLEGFGRAMANSRSWEVTENILEAFPWKDLRENAVIVDVGGGVGSTSVVIAKEFTQLRFVVQDRQQVVEIGPSAREAPNADLFTSGRISFQVQDFFTPQPPTLSVPGVGDVSAADVFVLRACTHNWPDADVVKMLRLLRAAAVAHTKLVVVDNLLPFACPASALAGATGEEEVPLPGARAPLLANLGRAMANGYALDITMFAIFNAYERTLHELAELAREAGWSVERVVRPRGTLWGYLTLAPA